MLDKISRVLNALGMFLLALPAGICVATLAVVVVIGAILAALSPLIIPVLIIILLIKCIF